MTTKPTKRRCGGLLAWKQVSGLLVTTAGVYWGRCPDCGRPKGQEVAPVLGQRCARLVSR